MKIKDILEQLLGFPHSSVGKESAAVQESWVLSLGREDPVEKEMATHSRILASRIPWTEDPGRLQIHGVTRVGHDLATKERERTVTEAIR